MVKINGVKSLSLWGIVFALSTVLSSAETDVQFLLTDPQFGISQTTNRLIQLQAETYASSGSTTLLPFKVTQYTDNSGQTTFSNIYGSSISGWYHVTIPAPPQRRESDIWVGSTNLGLVNVNTIFGVWNPSAAPAGGWSWTAAASDARYGSSLTNANAFDTNGAAAFYANSVTNGLASTNFVNTSIANNTNFPSIYVTNTLQVQGYVQGPLYITNSAFDISTNTASPSANQLVTANYVASILKSGQILYGSLNTTNVGITNRVGTTTNTVALLFGSTAPTNYIKSFTNLTAGQIFATIITTNAYQSVSGPFVSTFYLNFTGNGPNPSIQIDPDIYITYDNIEFY